MASDRRFELYCPAMTTASTPAPRGSARIATRTLLVLALVAIAVCAVRLRLLDVPLERDEGGFATVARLVLDGTPPYSGAYDYKPPGLYLVYASFIALLGGGPAGIRAGLLASSLATMVLTFLLVRRRAGDAGALVAAFLSQALLVSVSVLGFAAHATHFVVLFSLAGWLLLERGLDRRRGGVLAAAGAAFGCAALAKQPGILFFAAAVLLVLLTRGDRGAGAGAVVADAARLLAGFLLPVAAVVSWLSASGAFDAFVYWTVTYPSLVAAGSEATGILPRLLRNAVAAGGAYLPAWFAGAAAFAWLMTPGARAPGRTSLALLGAASALGVAMGYETRSHYFVLVLPALAAATGTAAGLLRSRGAGRAGRIVPLAAPLLLAAIGIAAEREYLFSAPPAAISRAVYAPNLFAEAGTAAAFIGSRTAPGDRIAVLGSEPEIYFLSGRRPATRYLFTNFFNERHGMKEAMEREMIREIDSAGPAAIVMVNEPFSWGARPDPEWTILSWAGDYLRTGYELAGTITPVPGAPPRVLWDASARREPGASAAPMVIYLRLRGD